MGQTGCPVSLPQWESVLELPQFKGISTTTFESRLLGNHEAAVATEQFDKFW